MQQHCDTLLVTCLSVKNITIRRDSVMDVCNEIIFEGIWSFMPVKKQWEEDRSIAANGASSLALVNRSLSLFVVLGVRGL